MSPAALVLAYCLLIVAASLVGGWLPSRVELTHTRLQVVMSFVAGLMLGVSLFHMLPHATREISIDRAIWWLMLGLMTMFFLVRVFDFHHHGPTEASDAEAAHGHSHGHDLERQHGRQHSGHHHPHDSRSRLSWVGVALGLSLHTAIDGIALAADVSANTGALKLAGLGTFLAISLHKPLDALSITSLMAAGGWPLRARQTVNASFALMCPLGAVLFAIGFAGRHEAVGCALAFSAGVFLCVSLGDLLPELQFHSHDPVKLSAALVLGLALAYGVDKLEHYGHQPIRPRVMSTQPPLSLP